MCVCATLQLDLLTWSKQNTGLLKYSKTSLADMQCVRSSTSNVVCLMLLINVDLKVSGSICFRSSRVVSFLKKIWQLVISQ